MQTATIQHLNQDVKTTLNVRQGNIYPSLDTEVRSAIPTDAASYHLNRKPQTLRAWACFENGPICPIRINGRLAWKVSDLMTLLGAAK